jgi:hypothetical protein
MPITHRFGKRIPLPSTRQIRHELILMWAEDELKNQLTPPGLPVGFFAGLLRNACQHRHGVAAP